MNENEVIKEIAESLISTNEIGDGVYDFRIEGETLLVDVYGDLIEAGVPKPDATYRISIQIEDVTGR